LIKRVAHGWVCSLRDFITTLLSYKDDINTVYYNNYDFTVSHVLSLHHSLLLGSTTNTIHQTTGRTLDWDLLALKELTIEVEFHRGGKLLFVSTTFAGYLGVLTAASPHKFAVAVNHRPNSTMTGVNINQGSKAKTSKGSSSSLLCFGSDKRGGNKKKNKRNSESDELQGDEVDPRFAWPIGFKLRDVCMSRTSDDCYYTLTIFVLTR